MNGLYLRKHGDSLENARQNSAQLDLLAKGDGADIMLQHIKEGECFVVEPCSSCETMEFFYILEGTLTYEHSLRTKDLKRGDYFYIHNLSEASHFRAASDITLLYFSTQPVFHYLSSSIDDLTKILKQVELKDMYTFNHCKRVKDYSLKVAKKLFISRERLEDLGFAALFHDIGKIHVPDSILNKPAGLTPEEFALIKAHPEDGKSMVKKTYYENIGRIIEQHHERLDGSGYPRGLKQDQIMLEARIIAVADSFDAMTTDRPYKQGMSYSEALYEIKSLVGKFYDAQVVKAFEEILIEDKML